MLLRLFAVVCLLSNVTTTQWSFTTTTSELTEVDAVDTDGGGDGSAEDTTTTELTTKTTVESTSSSTVSTTTTAETKTSETTTAEPSDPAETSKPAETSSMTSESNDQQPVLTTDHEGHHDGDGDGHEHHGHNHTEDEDGSISIGFEDDHDHDEATLNHVEFYNVYVKIQDSECYGATTESKFTVYIVSLDRDNYIVNYTEINSTQFDYDGKGHWIYEKKIQCDLSRHFQNYSIVFPSIPPRADVIFIEFENDPEDSWSIDQIDVDVDFVMVASGQSSRNDDKLQRYTWHFEQTVPMSCSAWITGHNLVQFGPRAGLFLLHEMGAKNDLLQIGAWVRDWI